MVTDKVKGYALWLPGHGQRQQNFIISPLVSTSEMVTDKVKGYALVSRETLGCPPALFIQPTAL
jgi:hypothetical protein